MSPQGKAAPDPTAAPTPTRVELHDGDRAVVVEADADLAVVARKAVALFNQIRAVESPGPSGAAVGFHLEAAAGPVPADLTLPARLTERGDDDGSRR